MAIPINTLGPRPTVKTGGFGYTPSYVHPMSAGPVAKPPVQKQSIDPNVYSGYGSYFGENPTTGGQGVAHGANPGADPTSLWMGVTSPGLPQQSQPDYSSMIGGDWEVQGAQAAMAAQMALARAQFQANLRQSFIDLGYSGDQSSLGDFSSYLDKDTIQKAIDNKYSAYSQIAKQQDTANATNNSQLAAMGMLSSGETGRSMQEVTNQAEQGRYSSLRDFLNQGTSGLQGIAMLKAQLAAQVAQAQAAAAARAAQMAAWGGQQGGGFNGYLSGGMVGNNYISTPNDYGYAGVWDGPPNMTNDQYASINEAWGNQPGMLPIHGNGAPNWGTPTVRPPVRSPYYYGSGPIGR